MQGIAPPSVSPHPEVVQDDSEVQTDLEADLALAQFREAARIALCAVGDRDEQVPEWSHREIEPAGQPGDLEIRALDLVRVVPALARHLAAGGVSGGGVAKT